MTCLTVNKFEDDLLVVHYLDTSLKKKHPLMFIGSTQTLDSMSCFLVTRVGLAKLLGLEPCYTVSHICDSVITNNTTEKLPDAKQNTVIRFNHKLIL